MFSFVFHWAESHSDDNISFVTCFEASNTWKKKKRVVAFAAEIDPRMKRCLFSPSRQHREEKRKDVCRCHYSDGALTLFVLYCSCSLTAQTDTSRAGGKVFYMCSAERWACAACLRWPHSHSRARSAVHSQTADLLNGSVGMKLRADLNWPCTETWSNMPLLAQHSLPLYNTYLPPTTVETCGSQTFRLVTT